MVKVTETYREHNVQCRIKKEDKNDRKFRTQPSGGSTHQAIAEYHRLMKADQREGARLWQSGV